MSATIPKFEIENAENTGTPPPSPASQASSGWWQNCTRELELETLRKHRIDLEDWTKSAAEITYSSNLYA